MPRWIPRSQRRVQQPQQTTYAFDWSGYVPDLFNFQNIVLKVSHRALPQLVDCTRTGPGGDPCPGPDEIEVSTIMDALPDLDPSIKLERTYLRKALDGAVGMLLDLDSDRVPVRGRTGKNQAVVMISDMQQGFVNTRRGGGANNINGYWLDLPSAIGALYESGVRRFALPTGQGANQRFAQTFAGESGEVFVSDFPPELLPAFAKTFARLEGDTMALDGEPVIHSGSDEFPIDETEIPIFVEEGAKRLEVMFATAQGWDPSGTSPLTLDRWQPQYELLDPDGSVALDSDDAGVLARRFFQVATVPGPQSGEWTLRTLPATDSGAFPSASLVSARVANTKPDCFVQAEPKTVTQGESVTLRARAFYGMLIRSGVAFTATIERPDGSSIDIPFDYDRFEEDHLAVIDPSMMIGSGAYRVKLHCEVSSDARFVEGEPITDAPPKPRGTIRPFQRTAATSFHLESSEQPDLAPDSDPDGDGVPTSDEGTGDSDGDGLIDARDSDSDNDDIIDGDDPDPTNPHVPFCSATGVSVDCCDSFDDCTGTEMPVLYADGDMVIADSAMLDGRDAISVPAGIYNSGGTTTVGSGAITGRIISAGNVNLAQDSWVIGGIETGGSINNAGATIEGGIAEQLSPDLPVLSGFSCDEPSHSLGNVTLAAGQDLTLAPADYGVITVVDGATLRLTAGTYSTTGLDVRPGSAVRIDTSGGPVRFSATDTLRLDGNLVDDTAGDDGASILFSYCGTATVVVPSGFSGTLVAPNATISISEGEHFGAFFGQSITVASGAIIRHRPFQNAWKPQATVPDTCTDDLDPPIIQAPDLEIERCAPEPAVTALSISVTDGSCPGNAQVLTFGRLISVNGRAVPSPVFFSGIMAQPILSPGTARIEWTAIDVNGNASRVTQTITITLSDTPDACCSAGQQVIEGNGLPNVFVFPLPAELCVFGKGSFDTLVTGPGADVLSGGSGLDVLTTGSAGDLCLGGSGPDVITLPVGSGSAFGGAGDDVMEITGGGIAHGNDGNDEIITIVGNHILYPGPGRDAVTAGAGNDTLVILDPCEIQPFEVLDGGLGTDTLRTPIPVADIFARGAVVTGVENVVLDATARHLSECFQ